MALQIGQFKPSQRKILPNLNVGAYKPTVEKGGRVYYRSKRKPIKSEMKSLLITEGGKTRFNLENKALAKRTARARQGAAIPKDEWKHWVNKPHRETPQSLKNGIIGMAKKSGISDPELFRKLNEMDADKLQEMYNRDELIFDVAFSYDQSDPYAGKQDDLEYMVSVYEERYGVLRW